MTQSKPKDLQSYKYLYIVNLHLQPGQKLPTFTPVPREGPENVFPRIAGQRMAKMALYYTDELVTEENIERVTEMILRGGKPNIIRPDEDDQALYQIITSKHGLSEAEFAKAVAAADEMKAIMAADGAFKFSLI
jgi:hypothetical protein